MCLCRGCFSRNWPAIPAITETLFKVCGRIPCRRSFVQLKPWVIAEAACSCLWFNVLFMLNLSTVFLRERCHTERKRLSPTYSLLSKHAHVCSRMNNLSTELTSRSLINTGSVKLIFLHRAAILKMISVKALHNPMNSQCLSVTLSCYYILWFYTIEV